MSAKTVLAIVYLSTSKAYLAATTQVRGMGRSKMSRESVAVHSPKCASQNVVAGFWPSIA